MAWSGSGWQVTPNKKANSAPMDYYRRLHEARREAGSHYLYEATVGAGLPVMTTLRDLRETGDRIRKIEGIFSGTLAYLFNVWDGSRPFSAVVRDAKANGYTEPDPRDDLSGTVNYEAVMQSIHRTVSSRRFRLVESLCSSLVDDIAQLPGIRALRVAVTKPRPMEGLGSVRIEQWRAL